MDEQDEKIIQQVKEELQALQSVWNYPFIVEITAAMILDAIGQTWAKRWTEDPALLHNIDLLIEFVSAFILEEKAADPSRVREESLLVKKNLHQEIPGYQPELDPESRAFDAEQYRAAVNEIGQGAFFDGVSTRLAEMIKEQEEITEMLPELEGIAFEAQKVAAQAQKYLELFNSDLFSELIRIAKEKGGKLAHRKDPRIIAKQAEKLLYPLDKPNSKIWNMLSEADAHGQMMMNFKTGKTKDVLVFYSINFDELDPALKISKKLTPYDKRVYIAAAALFNAGNEVITATQIFREMGNSSQPAPEQIQKIWDSLTKMRAAVIQLDNQKETETIKKYGAFKYDGQLLPFERISAYVNNTLTDAAIHLFREPPLVSFARQRNQVTTISRKLLESPISKTEANLQLEDYLLERIGHMKKPNSTTSRKMLYSTIFENCEIISRSQKSRAPEKIKRYLEWYKKEGWILGYEMQADGVKIIL